MNEILLTSSVLILALLVLRRLFREAIPRRVQYALWSLVLLRLLIPASLPAAEFSLLTAARPAAEELGGQSVYLNVVRETVEAPQGTNPLLVTPGGDVPIAVGPSSPDNVHTFTDRNQVTHSMEFEKQIPLVDLLRPVWQTGMAGMALWLALTNLLFWRRLRQTRTPYPAEGCRYPVYLCEGLASPCLFGLLRPAIYLNPAAVASPEALRHVLAHEETHARHLDPLWSLLRGVCLTVYWFDPLVWWAAFASRADCELACDEGAIRRLGEEERLAYGKTLLSLIPVQRLPQNPLLSATTMTAGKKQLFDRVKRIAQKHRPVVWAVALAVLAVGVVCAVTFTGAAEREPDVPRNPDSSVSTPQNPDSSAGAPQSPDIPDYLSQAPAPSGRFWFWGYEPWQASDDLDAWSEKYNLPFDFSPEDMAAAEQAVWEELERWAAEPWVLSFDVIKVESCRSETLWNWRMYFCSQSKLYTDWTREQMLQNYLVVAASYWCSYDHTKTPDGGAGYRTNSFVMVREDGQWTVHTSYPYLNTYWDDGVQWTLIHSERQFTRTLPDSSPEEAALLLAADYVEDMMTVNPKRSFTITEYKDLAVSVTPMLELYENDMEAAEMYEIQRREVTENAWLVKLDMLYRFDGLVSPLGPMPEPEAWIDLLYQGSPIDFLLTYNEEDQTYTLQSRWWIMNEGDPAAYWSYNEERSIYADLSS